MLKWTHDNMSHNFCIPIIPQFWRCWEPLNVFLLFSLYYSFRDRALNSQRRLWVCCSIFPETFVHWAQFIASKHCPVVLRQEPIVVFFACECYTDFQISRSPVASIDLSFGAVIFSGDESPFILLCLEQFKCPAAVIVLKAICLFHSKQKVTEIRGKKKYVYNGGMKWKQYCPLYIRTFTKV